MSLINIKKTISIMALIALTGTQCHAARQNPAIITTINEQFRQAAMEGNTELVTQLLERGANLKSINTDGKTALNLAVQYNRPDTIEFLLSRGAGYQPKSLQMLAARAAHHKLQQDAKFAGETTVSQACLNHAKLSQAGLTLCFMEDIMQQANGNPLSALLAVIQYPSRDEFKNCSPEIIKTVQQQSRDIVSQILIEYKEQLDAPICTQALSIAAEIGDPAMILLLLNTQAHIGIHTLKCVIEKGDAQIVKILLNTIKEKYRCRLLAEKKIITEDKLQSQVIKCINTNTSSNRLDTFLIIAAENGYTDVVRILLDAQININQTNASGQTALMSAIQAQHEETISILLDAGADVFAITRRGDSALSYAAGNGNTKRVNQLLNILLTSIEQNDFLRLHYCDVVSAAIRGNHVEMVHLLLQAVKENPEINLIIQHAFSYAFAKGSIETVHLFLDTEIEKRSCTSWGLTSAVPTVNKEHAAQVARLCQNAGLDITGDAGTRALLSASQTQHIETVCLLLNLGVQVADAIDQNGDSALICAVRPPANLDTIASGIRIKLIQMLLHAGAADLAYINMRTANGQTALAVAIEYAEFLMQHINDIKQSRQKFNLQDPTIQQSKLEETEKLKLEETENLKLEKTKNLKLEKTKKSQLEEQLLIIDELLRAGTIVDDKIRTDIEQLKLEFRQYIGS